MTYAGTLVRPSAAALADASRDRLVCLSCERGWEHCHDAMVVHTDGEAECTASTACLLTVELHILRVGCADLQPQCRCGE